SASARRADGKISQSLRRPFAALSCAERPQRPDASRSVAPLQKHLPGDVFFATSGVGENIFQPHSLSARVPSMRRAGAPPCFPAPRCAAFLTSFCEPDPEQATSCGG